MTEEMKKPGNAGTLAPAKTNHYRNNTTKTQIVSMLEALLKCCDEGVAALLPIYDEGSGWTDLTEVMVVFNGGGTRRVNVHADSHLAICKDVLNQAFR